MMLSDNELRNKASSRDSLVKFSTEDTSIARCSDGSDTPKWYRAQLVNKSNENSSKYLIINYLLLI